MLALRTSVSKEVGLRKQLLNKIFLRTLEWDPLPHPPMETPCSPVLNLTREQIMIVQCNEQEVEMKNENMSSFCSEATESISTNKASTLTTCVKSGDNRISVEPNNLASHCTSKEYFSKSKKVSKKYSKVLTRIENLERSVAVFCDKENRTLNEKVVSKSQISIFQNIKTSQQKKKYEKYFKKTLKVCYRLEEEISLCSQYVETLETVVASTPKISKLHKMLEAKLRAAQKFQDESPSHEQLSMLLRQVKLVNLLLNKFENEKRHK